jgi:hypothetical protein
MQNPDLRKKLRVDRIRKMAMGGGQTVNQSVVEDPKQPDWKKYKTLQEIDMIRQTKKDMIISQVMGSYMAESKQVSVVPGDLSFMVLPLENVSQQRQVYQIAIHDPDSNFLEREEVTMVYSAHEFEHWVKQGKVKKPLSYDMITSIDTVLLNPGQKIDLLFKFQTFREVSHNVNVVASPDVIKQR